MHKYPQESLNMQLYAKNMHKICCCIDLNMLNTSIHWQKICKIYA